jgi:dihydropteroate synthase
MPPFAWNCSRPLVMGIVNVTPDSFSDGGRFSDADAAVEHALRLVAEGADILDIGGESTRPGAASVPAEEELRRVVPVIARLAKLVRIPISIDTSKAGVAEACLAVGASIINDVAGLRDPAMVEVAARTGAGVVVMHMQGDPRTMQIDPTYDDVVEGVQRFFAERIETLLSAGIARSAIALDPGIGFGKKLDHTLQQLRELPRLQAFGLPVCLGVSRKGFLGQIAGRPRTERAEASLAVACFALAQGSAQILRVHDVQAHADAVKLWRAIHPS